MNCKDIIGSIIAFVVIIGGAFFIGWSAITSTVQLRTHELFIDQSIGKTIVMGNDTLLIVNYQHGGFGNPTGFILTNGVIIDDEIVKTHEIH